MKKLFAAKNENFFFPTSKRLLKVIAVNEE